MTLRCGPVFLPCLVLGVVVTVMSYEWSSDAFVENKSMNPCEDFYTYTCESQYINPDGSISSFKSLVAEAQDNVIAKLRDILEGDDMQNFFPIKIAKTFYTSCMDTERIDAQGIKPIYSVLKELKGWPLAFKHSDKKNIVNWQDLHAFYSKINVFPLFEISVNNDAIKQSQTILLRQPKMIVREPLLYRAKTFYKYVDYIKTVAMIVANLSESNVSEQEIVIEAKQIASFEVELLKIMETNERLGFYRPIVLKKFQNITDQLANDGIYVLNWVKILNGMLFASYKSITPEDVIDISTLSYFPRLIQLLRKTSTRTIVNYIHWRFVHQFLPHISNELRNLYFDMKHFMQEPIKNMTRWRFCAFEPAFDHAISYAFAKKHLSKIEKYVQRILNDVKQVMIKVIRRSLLLKDEEKNVAEQKISSMNFVLGIPDSLRNVSVINGYYNKLTISKNYFNNVLTLRKFYKMKEFEFLRRNNLKSLVNNNNFIKITTLSSIGSAYDFFNNRVLIKAENLVEPLFDPNYPDFMKYGMLGFTISYEIMHAFNDADSIGNTIPPKHLYSEETKLKYWNKIECFINQFDNYYIPDSLDSKKHIYVDGERSAMENIADSAAIQIAFQAYKERSRKQGVSSIEDDEEFFASFASLLCRPELEDFYLSRFNLALRTLPRFRVIGSLSNSGEFAKAFSCSRESRMNPEMKCNFWN